MFLTNYLILLKLIAILFGWKNKRFTNTDGPVKNQLRCVGDGLNPGNLNKFSFDRPINRCNLRRSEANTPIFYKTGLKSLKVTM